MLKKDYGRRLSDRTSFKIGGPAFCWLEPEDFDDVLEAIAIAEKDDRDLAMIGRGSNILAHDKGFDGVVVSLGKGFDFIEEEQDGLIRLGAGVPVFRLVNRCAELGLSGCEFLSGIPGCAGGAIFMNAGVRDVEDSKNFKEIKDIIIDVDVIDLKEGKRKTLKKAEADFSYRSSGLEGRIILGARFSLKKEKKDVIKERALSFMKRRSWMQKIKLPTAGSVFKNPDSENPAGRLIEQCGLKGRRIGGAEISNMHANFIVNTGNALAKDVLDLIGLARTKVKERFGVDLELELKII